MTTAKTLNGDAEQRSLPLVLTIYQLMQKSLSKKTIVAKQNYVFYASGQQRLFINISPKAKFILAKANYRVADNTIQALYPLQQADGGGIKQFSIYLDDHHLSMEPLS